MSYAYLFKYIIIGDTGKYMNLLFIHYYIDVSFLCAISYQKRQVDRDSIGNNRNVH